MRPRDRVDWRAARTAKTKLLNAAYDALMTSQSPLRGEFERFRNDASAALKRHALFEAIREAQAPEWDWRKWPAPYRSPDAEGAKRFAGEHGDAVARQIFLQWVTQRSLDAAHEAGKRAGMRVGLIADIAAGLDPAGSDAWARPDALLQGLTMGAPPDPYTPPGQDWKLTTFSPHGLAATGYRDLHRHVPRLPRPCRRAQARSRHGHAAAVADSRRHGAEGRDLCQLSQRDPVPADRAGDVATPRGRDRRGPRHASRGFPRISRRAGHLRHAAAAHPARQEGLAARRSNGRRARRR